MKSTLLILSVLLSSAAFSQQTSTILTTGNMTLEQRAALRVLISQRPGNMITGYKQADKSFFISSADDHRAGDLKKEIAVGFPTVEITNTDMPTAAAANYVQVGFKIISDEQDFPVYVITGDHELDERSYSLEKKAWMDQHKSPIKK